MNEDSIRTAFASNLAECRKAAGLTQTALAEQLNYSDKSVSKWERGEGIPDIFVLAQLTEIFGCTADALLGLETKTMPVFDRQRASAVKRRIIPVLSVLLAWLTAAVAYFVFAILPFSIPHTWLAFIYAIPASFIVLTVFFRLWYGILPQAIAVSGIIWGVALSLRLTFSMPAFDLLFIIASILQVLTVLWFVMRSRIKSGM
ncbi:MAG: helix-turn-helix transcriptional regulator [Clostridia bacterium]|nr:helix-turn-helix transcriptional regulator [Clostridia bacterium]